MSEIGLTQLKEDLATHGFFYCARRSGVCDVSQNMAQAADALDFRYFKTDRVGLSIRDEGFRELITGDRLTKMCELISQKYGLDKLILEVAISYTLMVGYLRPANERP